MNTFISTSDHRDFNVYLRTTDIAGMRGALWNENGRLETEVLTFVFITASGIRF